MQIIRNEQSATITFVPVEESEAEVLKQIVAIAKPDGSMAYGGCAGKDGSKPYTVHLHIGSRTEEVVKKEGNVTFHSHEEIGGVKLELRGSGEGNEREVRRIRDTCYFGSGGLIFLGSSEIDGKIAIITTAKRCQHCGAGMIKLGRCEWKTCDACADKCEHNYIRGIVHGGNAGDMGMGEYCAKCGRGKPEPEGTRQKGQLERELEVQREMGVNVFYKEGPIQTPEQAVKVDRLLRRHRKASSRS